APGATIQCEATHVVTQADIDAGTYSNTAIADSNETLPSNATATVPIGQRPAITVAKTVTSSGPYDTVGQQITFAIAVTNTGNQPLSGVTVTDPAAVLGTCTPALPATLAPGGSVMCQATHAVTQADINAGTYTNVSTGDSDQTPPADGAVTVPIT